MEDKMEKKVTFLYAVLKTAVMVTAWISFGMTKEITGPAMQDLKYRADTTYEAIAATVSARGFGNFFGAVLGGILVDKFGRYCDLMNAGWFALMAVMSFATPFTTSIPVLYALFGITGVASAAVNTGVEKVMLNLWKEKVTSPMHALHFGYGVGSFLIPLMCNPFLGVFIPKDTANLTTNMSYSNESYSNVSWRNQSVGVDGNANGQDLILVGSRVEYAFYLVGFIGMLIALAFLLYQFCFYRNIVYVKEKTKPQNRRFIDMWNPATCADGNFCYGLIMYILVFFFYFGTNSAQRSYSNFIRAYSIDLLKFSKTDGSWINSVFWIGFSAGRLSGVLVGKFIKIRKLVLIETIGLFCAALFLMVLSHVSPVYVAWVCTALFGFFQGPLYPSGIAFADYHVELTGIGIMVQSIGGGFGSMCSVWITGRLFDSYGPGSFIYMMLGIGCFVLFISILQVCLGLKHGSRFKGEETHVDNENEADDEAKGSFITQNASSL